MTSETLSSAPLKAPPQGHGVRRLTLADQLPDCRISIRTPLYDLADICRGKEVVDIGCGFGRNRTIVEGVGGIWVGIEPFEGGGHTVLASADDLPFEDASFDVAIMDAVLEHLPNVETSFTEVARVLRPNGVFIGYVAFMECFHEISYYHLSFKALEHLARKNGLVLEAISGGSSFGINYHTAVLLYPIKLGWGRAAISSSIRGLVRLKALAARVARRIVKHDTPEQAKLWAKQYYQLECLRQSNGFQFIIRRPIGG